MDCDEGQCRDFLLAELAKRLALIGKYVEMLNLTTDTKRTRNGLHIRIRFRCPEGIDDKDIVILQLLLLSDWKREMFNFFRVRNRFTKWNVLFRNKYKVVEQKGTVADGKDTMSLKLERISGEDDEKRA